MLRSCHWCGRIHDTSIVCSKRPAPKKESTEHTKLRTCRRWDKARKDANARDKYVCRVCAQNGHLTVDGLETHHIVPLSEDPSRAYDLDNLITLCVRHHKAADVGKIDRSMLVGMAKDQNWSIRAPRGSEGG